MKTMRTLYITIPAILIAAIVAAVTPIQFTPEQDNKPSLEGATGWLNTTPLKLEGLRGKVVLIDFWTYTCINWRRTMPYVRDWASKYKDQGLVVIGVHTPEFSFEQEIENIRNANREMNIGYPVAVDSHYEIWNSFQNHYWPALYLIDANGKIRYQKFGEGDYREIELKIQQLLREVSPRNTAIQLSEIQPGGAEAAADWRNVGSPENYVGYGQTQGFASPGGIISDKTVTYTVPSALQLNQWALIGEWNIGKEKVLLTGKQGKLIYRFHARDLNLIIGPAGKGKTIKFRITINGDIPGASHGLDTDENGNGTMTEPRMYQLIRQQGPIIDRDFQIEFLTPKAEVYDFTFG
ncbi:MAG: thioredoxin family protein [Mucilaginibacter sp.]|jgi:thiol-disulfide isomerase/thioredoxin|uniref:thioredoxin family protein n=1 Tax=Mucilaginibacter sp. TaxID=1882438 RepID=UPI0035671019